MVTPAATLGRTAVRRRHLVRRHNLDQWVSTKDKSPATWKVADGVLTVDKSVGNIETKRNFTNYQIHIEWRIPADITGRRSGARQQRPVPRVDRRRATPATSCRSWTRTTTRPTSTVRPASVYKQYIPLVNASRKPGEWQTYDVIWTAPDFQRRRLAEDAGLRHRLPQRRAGSEPRRAEGGNASTSGSRNTRSTAPARRSSCRRTAIRARRSASAISGSASSEVHDQDEANSFNRGPSSARRIIRSKWSPIFSRTRIDPWLSGDVMATSRRRPTTDRA